MQTKIQTDPHLGLKIFLEAYPTTKVNARHFNCAVKTDRAMYRRNFGDRMEYLASV